MFRPCVLSEYVIRSAIGREFCSAEMPAASTSRSEASRFRIGSMLLKGTASLSATS